MALPARQGILARNALLRAFNLCREVQVTTSSTNFSQLTLPSFQSPRAISDRHFGSSSTCHSLADQQFSVIAPSAPGGPISRTPVYAIFELGSKQYKVSAGDVIWVERLKLVDVGTQLALNRVQVVASQTETVVGRPYVDNASVTAVVEEQVQDAKVVIFKKRRRKHSRRLKGHRQLLTGLRITGVNGIMAPEGSKAEVVVG